MAFLAEMEEAEAEEKNDSVPFDCKEEDEDIGDEEGEQDAAADGQEMLEEIPLPGRCQDERSRKEAWLKLPRPARAAIRRMHEQFGHAPKEPLVEILTIARCPEEYIQFAKHLRCIHCERNQQLPKQTTKFAFARPYVFNDTAGTDVMFLDTTY